MSEHEIFYKMYEKNLRLELVDKCYIRDFLFAFDNDPLCYDHLRLDKRETSFKEDSFNVYNVYDIIDEKKIYYGCCFLRAQACEKLYPRDIQKIEYVNYVTFKNDNLLVKMQTVKNYNDRVIINQQFTDKGCLVLSKGLIYAFDFYNPEGSVALATVSYLHKKREDDTEDIVDAIYFLVKSISTSSVED